MQVKTTLEARHKVLSDIRDWTVGPQWQDDTITFTKKDPLTQYAAGILFPRASLNLQIISDDEHTQEEVNDTQSVDGLNIESNYNEDVEGRNDGYTENIIDQSTQSRQSSFGITFITKDNDHIKIDYGFSKYLDAGTGKEKRFVQERIASFKELKVSSLNPIQKFSKISDEPLELKARSRKKDGLLMTTISISHSEIINSDNNMKCSFSECFFHVGMKITNLTSPFHEIKPLIFHGQDQQAEILNLLFRKKKSYSVGTGCGTDWTVNNEECYEINTDFMPTYELPNIEAKSKGFNLNYAELANIDNRISEDQYFKPIDKLKDNYEKWIYDQKTQASDLEEEYKKAAQLNIEAIEVWFRRISRGIQIIKNDEEALKAFKLANLSMLIQFNRFRNLKSKKSNEPLKTIDKKEAFDKSFDPEIFINNITNNRYSGLTGAWRPFQFAFVLGIIADITDLAEDADLSFRDEVDLIWFPTGGGKTEAYLGALAFTILLRRLRDPSNAGITAIMRYTLRLLTSDQFRRSSALICALEHIRKNKILGAELGEESISLGLWMGKDGTKANTHSDAIKVMKDPQYKKKKKLPFILHECPWCKTYLLDPSDSGYKTIKKEVVVKCPDKTCSFSDAIPIFQWQEAVLENKPSLLIGTVDNFAKLAWDTDEKVHSAFLNDSFSPPDLIIQDELHLISGPLGSVVGMFENILLRLLEQNGNKPKIIGATATLSLGGNQSKNLYRGRSSSIFPPQGLEWGNSFFAEEKSIEEKPGRLYVGYFGSVKNSMIESAFNASIPLLQSPQIMHPVTLDSFEKGEKDLRVAWPKNFKEGSKISILHVIKKEKVYKEYIVKNIVPIDETDQSENAYFEAIITLQEALTAGIKSNTAFYFIETDLYTQHQEAFNPFGTLIWYFNSKRELADISNQLIRLGQVLKTNARFHNAGRLGTKEHPIKFSRQLQNCEELTGRLSQEEIEVIKNKIEKKWLQTSQTPNNYEKGIDIVFATNMISVGVDIPRLGAMIMHGQPRTTAEYIQASSRVGRTHPGIVITAYNHNKSKDRSIYEMFKNFHQSIYRYVESSSVTPYSKGSRDKNLEAIFVGLAKVNGVKGPGLVPSDKKYTEEAKNWILDSVREVDPEEESATEIELNRIIKVWENAVVDNHGSMGKNAEGINLLGKQGGFKNPNNVFEIPTTMRNSDADTWIELKGVDYEE